MLTLLQVLFYFVAIAGGAYFLALRRRFDFFALGFASAVVYFLPGFFGFVRSSRDFTLPEPLQPGTYAVFLVVMLAILVGAALFDRLLSDSRSLRKHEVSTRLTSETALAMALFGLAVTVLTSGGDLFSAQKADVMEATGRWHVLFRFGAIYLLACAVHQRQRGLAVVGILLLAFDLYIGFRVGLVIGILAAATLVLNRRGAQSLFRQERRALVAGVVLVAVIFIYKRIYTVVKLGLWDTVVARLTDPDILFLALMTSEPFGTQSVLNEIIRTDFHTGPAHLSGLVSLLVPFSSMLGAEVTSFNSLFQERLFGGVVRGGLAANIWGQMFAIGGWLGIAVGIPIYVTMLGVGSWLLNNARGAMVILVAVAFSFLAFYIHRNDVLYTFVLMRRALMIWLVLIVPAMLLVDARRAYRSGTASVASS